MEDTHSNSICLQNYLTDVDTATISDTYIVSQNLHQTKLELSAFW
jgi:ABC-type metal ion transport system substrate-binding protein